MDETAVSLQKKTKDEAKKSTQQWITSVYEESETNTEHLQFSIMCSIDNDNDMVLSTFLPSNLTIRGTGCFI